MPRVATAPTYGELQQKIKLHLARAMELNQLDSEDLLTILFIFGQTSNLLELELFLDIFSDAFPVLKTVEIEKRTRIKVNIEEKVQKVVSKLVFTNPKRAAEIAKAALSKDASWDELVKKYPELGEV